MTLIVKKKPLIKKKELLLRCECGDERCGKLLILLFKAGKESPIIEIGHIPYKRKRMTQGVVLREKFLPKLRKFLNGA